LEENEKAKNEEISRRKISKESQDAIKKSQGTKSKRETEDFQKQKREDLISKKKIREQIEADRLERKKLFSNSQVAEVKKEVSGMSLSSTKEQTAQTKIAFRLADGGLITSQFMRSDPLSAAKSYISMNCNYKKFTMARAYPRHIFTEDEMNWSLEELQLHPNGTILIASPENDAPQPSIDPPSIPSWTNSISQYWSSLSSYFMPTPTTNNEIGNHNPSSSDSGDISEETGSTSSPPRGVTQRIRGNVHRLNHEEDMDEDRNKYWNGNSTQQQ